MVLLNLSILFVCFSLFFILYNKYYRRATINRYRFRFFEMRDNLTLLVMSGQVSVSNSDYNTLLKLINKSIQVYDEKFSFTGLIKYFSVIAADNHFNKKISEMVKNLQENSNTKLAAVACDYFEINYEIYRKYTKRTPFAFCLGVVKFFSNVREIKNNFHELQERALLQKNIDSQLESNISRLRPVCVC